MSTTHKEITCDECGDSELVDVSHVDNQEEKDMRKRASRIAGWAWISDSGDLLCIRCFDTLNPYVQ